MVDPEDATPDHDDDQADDHADDQGEAGRSIVTASWASTLALGLAAVVSVMVEPLDWVIVPVAVILAVIGFVAFVASYLTAVARSRTDEITVAGVYFLIGCAPKPVQRTLLWSFGAQVAIAIGAASLRPYTAVAFAILAPLDGIGLSGLWGARHGTFPPRKDPDEGRVPRPGRGPR